MADELIKAGGVEVYIDRTLMNFNEANLNGYLQKEGPQCDYLLSKLAELEAEHERRYSEKFVEFKEEGGTEKLVEARCKSNPELVAFVYAIKKIKNHLKAWDMNHANAQSFGHNLRKEFDKMGNEIRFRQDPSIDDRVMEIVKATTRENNEASLD